MSLRRGWSVAVLLGLSAALRVAAAEPAVVLVKPLDPGPTLAHVKPASVLVPPSHGQLEPTGAGLQFLPSDSFWALGVDSLVYEAEGRVETLVLVRAGNRDHLTQDFEPNSPAWPRQGGGARLTITPAAALEGQIGARLTNGPLPDYLQVSVPFDTDSGTGQQGTGSGMKIRLPVGGGGGGLTEPYLVFHQIQRADASAPAVRLAVRNMGNSSYSLRLDARHQTPAFVNLTAGTHRLALHWRQGVPEGPAEARLTVNDLVVVECPGAGPGSGGPPEAGLTVDVDHAFGALNEGTDRWALDIDGLTVDTGPAGAGSELVLANDFERDAEPWAESGMSGPAGPRLSEQGALSGKRGVLLELAQGERGYWHSSLPEAETALGLRLGLLLGEGASAPSGGLTILGGSSSDSVQDAIDVFRLALVKHEDGVHLEATTWAADGIPLARSVALEERRAHVVELQWYAAGASGDGLLRLWLNGALAGEITQIQAVPKPLESLKLGVLGAGPGGGQASVDDILVWRPARKAPAPATVTLP